MRQFWHDRKGNVAILFALAAVPVMGAMGAALDYSMANSYRSSMQKAVDATALALSKVMPLEQAKLDQVAMEYFTANLGQHQMKNLLVKAVPGQGTVQIDATADYDPIMAKLFGATEFQIGVEAVARWGIGKVEVALVLDNSGSMRQQKRMTHLKAASHDLLAVLEDAAVTPGDAKVAIVPFDSSVRLPYTQSNAPNWIKWGSSGTCSIPSSWQSNTQTQDGCRGAGGVWTWNSWTSTKWSSWSGCVEDRDKDPGVNNDVFDTAPDTSISTSASALRTKYPARACDDNSMVTILPLTTNWGSANSNSNSTLHGKVNLMQPSGFTNIALGLVWGWHVLSPTQLYTEGAAYNTDDLTKYIVLMTDGDNTRSRFDNCRGSGSCSIDSRTETVCTNIKNAGIQIFTIRLVEGNASLLQNCATNPSMYYDVQDAGMLSSIFKNIASQIASLHLSK